MKIRCRLFALLLAGLPAASLAAEPDTDWGAEIYARAQPSVVTVKQVDEHGVELGLGTGFAIESGLIATCYHVIGENQRLVIEWPDGREIPVAGIAAWNEAADLAVLSPATGTLAPLPALPLAEEVNAAPGAGVLALGNPTGLRGSVTSGVISARREMEGREVLQVAIPIEKGNSGGPLLDSRGRVIGIVTMKSAVTENLGFAVPVAELRSLLRNPNPVSMDTWLGFEALDLRAWTPLLGGIWRNRSGAITTGCRGESGSGRTLCLQANAASEAAGDLCVWVRLQSEAGGAGLAFGRNAEGDHFGFFFSEEKLWLVEFSGDDSTDWQVKKSVPAPGWRVEGWNELGLTFTEGEWIGSLNGEVILRTLAAAPLEGCTFGLLKLGRARADFRELALEATPAGRAVGRCPESLLTRFATSTPAEAAPAELESAARVLQDRAGQLRVESRKRAQHQQQEELARLVAQPGFDPAQAAFLIGALAAPEVAAEPFVRQWERLRRRLAEKREEAPEARLTAARSGLHEELGLRVLAANRLEGENYLPQRALDTRRAAPALMRCLWLSLADAAELPLVPLAAPEYLGWEPAEVNAPWRLLDLRTGELLSAEASEPLLKTRTEEAPRSAWSERRSRCSVVTSVLREMTMLGIHSERLCPPVLDALLLLDPEATQPRLLRCLLRLRRGDREGWRADWDQLCAEDPSYRLNGWSEAKFAEVSRETEVWRRGLPSADSAHAGHSHTEP